MKKRAILTAIAASLVLATPALAGSSGVMKGLQDGSLTSSEVYELVTFQAEVDSLAWQHRCALCLHLPRPA